MRIRFTSFVLVLGVLTAVGLTGCSTSARSALRDDGGAAASAPKPIARPDLAVDVVKTADGASEMGTMPAQQPMYYSRDVGRGWNGTCGLPCESGCGDWHARAVGGWPFFAGDDSDLDGCYYWGVDVGHTFPCCWGVDVFFRTFGAEADRDIPVVGAAVFEGTDSGSWYTIGVKATWQNSIRNSKWFYYAGIGPEFYFTQDYVDDDSGFGAFGELGIGYVINRHWRIRGGLDVHGLYTSAARRNPANDNSDRWLWVFAPVLQVEYDL